ncbi:MAG: hypothetical protein I8H90_26115 [Burkholderiales bacterium]|nr:hypothetical protein [Burkholderiales bacterium]
MEFRDVTNDERAQIYDWNEEASKLKRRRQVFFNELSDAFAPDSDTSHLGIEFSPDPSAENSLLVKTPVSTGRMRFSIAPVDSSLVGKVLVERAEVDRSGAQVWVPAWGFCLGDTRSIIYFNAPYDAEAYRPDMNERQPRREAFGRIGRSIAYALAAGPLLKD